MCYFLTIGINAGNELLVDVFQEAGFEVEQSSNVSLIDACGPERTLFEIAQGGCSCSIFSSPKSKKDRPVRESFSAAVGAAAERGGSIVLFVHWYSGDTATETLQPRPGPSIPVETYVASSRKLPKDTLVTVRGVHA